MAYDHPTQPNETLTGDSRGVAIQLDFITAMVLIISSFTLFLFAGLGLFETVTDDEPSLDVNAMRGADVLADDYLVTTVNNGTLNQTCTVAFFSETPDSSCGHDPDWGDDDLPYLNDALNRPSVNINVTITDLDGNHQSLGGELLSVGPSTDEAFGEIYTWRRYVALDTGTGQPEIHRLEVAVWR